MASFVRNVFGYRGRWAIAALVASAGLAMGQPVVGAGRGAEGERALLRVPMAPVASGPVAFGARRAWTWNEVRGGVRVTRLMLDDGVEIVLGDVGFKADKAVVWLSPEPIGGGRVRQHVFVFAENVRTPLADPAVGLRADRLPVSIVIEPDGAVRLTADARFDGEPERHAGFIAEGERRLGQMLRGETDAPKRAAGVDARRVRPLVNLDAEAVPMEPVRPIPVVPSRAVPAPSARPSAATRDTDRTDDAAGGEARALTRSTEDSSAASSRVRAAPAPAEASTPVEETERVATVPAGVGIEDGPTAEDDATDVAVEAAPPRRAIFTSDGVFYISAGERAVVQQEADANTVTILGGVVVQYLGAEGSLEIEADRAVVFLKPGPLRDTLGAMRPEDIEGMYLEGAVRAGDGNYTLRGERLYYDVQRNKALSLDAVFWTFQQQLGLSLYMRAKVIRQEAANEFVAENARFSNSAFFRPHFGIGARNMTITQRENAAGETSNIIDARGITLRAGRVPFFYFPFYRGDPERIPLRNVTYRDSNREGFVIRSEWDPFVLLGIKPPAGVDAVLDIDTYAERGIGVGVRSAWQTPDHLGDLTAYVLPDDGQDDIGTSGLEVPRANEFRGIVLARDRWRLRPEWTLIGELGFVSDETLTSDLFRYVGQGADEVTTRLHLRRLEENTMLSFEARTTMNDFVVNENTAQAPGYLVDKLPEVEVDVIAEDASPFLPPGWLTHTWEAGAASMRLRFPEVTARELGYPFDSLSQLAFGVNADESVGDVLRQQGLNESIVNRFDTRHEFTAPIKAGALNITPFVVGRLTAYDTDFEGFSPDEGESVRFWGSAGVRVGTSFQRVYDGVESRTFDLHRLRHIIEPSITIWHAETSIAAQDLPIYDDDVEQLGEGSAIRVALEQTFQTKRGGPGRWRNVDVLTLRTEYVWAADSTERGTPIGRWFDARPELGSPQRYAAADFVWRTSEIVSVLGEVVYNPDISAASRTAIGVRVEPGRGFDALVGLRRLEAQDSTYLDSGLGYLFGDKYQISAGAQYNFVLSDFQAFTLAVLRDFPVGQMGVVVLFDNIRETTSFGFQFRPLGLGQAVASDFEGTPLSRPGSLRRR